MELQAEAARTRAAARSFAPCRTIVLVGLMGAGKTKIGRRLAARLNLPFFDSDNEIEEAAGETIEEIFRNRGEAAFRDGERRVISRLLGQPTHILATGGGAFMDASTRAAILDAGVSIWLRADLDVLLARVARRTNRPLLKERDSRAVMAELIERRHPIYAEADLTVDSSEGPPEATVTRVIAALSDCPRAQLPPLREGTE
jgi:shikimate kinase